MFLPSFMVLLVPTLYASALWARTMGTSGDTWHSSPVTGRHYRLGGGAENVSSPQTGYHLETGCSWTGTAQPLAYGRWYLCCLNIPKSSNPSVVVHIQVQSTNDDKYYIDAGIADGSSSSCDSAINNRNSQFEKYIGGSNAFQDVTTTIAGSQSYYTGLVWFYCNNYYETCQLDTSITFNVASPSPSHSRTPSRSPTPTRSRTPAQSSSVIPPEANLVDGTYVVLAFQGVLAVSNNGKYGVLTQGSGQCFFTINYNIYYSGTNTVTLDPLQCTPSGKSSCYCYEQDSLTGTYVATSGGDYVVTLVDYGSVTLEVSKTPAAYIPPCTYTSLGLDGTTGKTTVTTQGSSSRAVTTTYLEDCTFTTYDGVYYTGGQNASIADTQACHTSGPSNCYCSASGVVPGQYEVDSAGNVYLSSQGITLVTLKNPQDCQDGKKSLTGGDDVLIFGAAGAGLLGMLLLGFWCHRRRHANSKEVSLNTVENQGASLPYEQIQ
jgi:hypothetical protein